MEKRKRKYSEVDIMDFKILAYEEQTSMIKKKVDDIFLLSSLFGYTTTTYKSVDYFIVECYSKKNGKLFNLFISKNEDTQKINHAYLDYVNNLGKNAFISLRERSLKYILNKAVYLIK